MIAQVNTTQRRTRFGNACRGKWVLGATLPLDLALFGKSQPWRFYAGPTLALELSGSAAWAAGHANPEELAGFLAFYSARLTWQSWDIDDISVGIDATPMWIPQILMALGTLIFFIALCDELVLELLGKRQTTVNEDAHHE